MEKGGALRYVFAFGDELIRTWRRVRHKRIEAEDWRGLFCAGGEI